MPNRRTFLKCALLAGGSVFVVRHVPSSLARSNRKGMTLAVQTWTFRLFDIDEAVRRARRAGAAYIEISGSIRLRGKTMRAVELPPEDRKYLRSILEENQVRGISLGGSRGTIEEFEFAREMDFEVMQGEPAFENLREISMRAEEYRIPFALHNHAVPNRYWNYKETLKRLDDCSSWLGFCPDTGHMMRSGIDPLQAVRDLKGKIHGIHLKDLNDMNSFEGPKKELHDVPWGTGKGQVGEILAELREQDFNGPVIVEYEYDWEDNVSQVAECINYFKHFAVQQ